MTELFEPILFLAQTIGIGGTFGVLFYFYAREITSSYTLRAKADDDFQSKQLDSFAEAMAALQQDRERLFKAFDEEQRINREERQKDREVREMFLQEQREDRKYRERLQKSLEAHMNANAVGLANVEVAMNSTKQSLAGVRASLAEVQQALETINENLGILKTNSTIDRETLSELVTNIVALRDEVRAIKESLNRAAVSSSGSEQSETAEEAKTK